MANEEARNPLRIPLKIVIHDATKYTEYTNRQTIPDTDCVYDLKRFCRQCVDQTTHEHRETTRTLQPHAALSSASLSELSSSSPLLAPTSSMTLLAPTSSTPLLAPTSSTPLLAPSSMLLKENTSESHDEYEEIEGSTYYLKSPSIEESSMPSSSSLTLSKEQIHLDSVKNLVDIKCMNLISGIHRIIYGHTGCGSTRMRLSQPQAALTFSTSLPAQTSTTSLLAPALSTSLPTQTLSIENITNGTLRTDYGYTETARYTQPQAAPTFSPPLPAQTSMNSLLAPVLSTLLQTQTLSIENTTNGSRRTTSMDTETARSSQPQAVPTFSTSLPAKMSTTSLLAPALSTSLPTQTLSTENTTNGTLRTTYGDTDTARSLQPQAAPTFSPSLTAQTSTTSLLAPTLSTSLPTQTLSVKNITNGTHRTTYGDTETARSAQPQATPTFSTSLTAQTSTISLLAPALSTSLPTQTLSIENTTNGTHRTTYEESETARSLQPQAAPTFSMSLPTQTLSKVNTTGAFRYCDNTT